MPTEFMLCARSPAILENSSDNENEEGHQDESSDHHNGILNVQVTIPL